MQKCDLGGREDRVVNRPSTTGGWDRPLWFMVRLAGESAAITGVRAGARGRDDVRMPSPGGQPPGWWAVPSRRPPQGVPHGRPWGSVARSGLRRGPPHGLPYVGLPTGLEALGRRERPRSTPENQWQKLATDLCVRKPYRRVHAANDE